VPGLRTLLLDNYDSFTYNLFALLAEVNGSEPTVVRNDAAQWPELELLEFDNIVISPGPGRPDRQADFGVCAEAIRRAQVPLLGVCLGHQGLCWVHGARVESAPTPVHGRASAVVHEQSPLFAGIPREFQAVRYHSLCAAQPLPAHLEAIAQTSDGVLMAVAHRRRLQWGVQFHPESICTEHGRRLLANFRDLTAAAGALAAAPSRGRAASTRAQRRACPRAPTPSGASAQPRADLAVHVRRLDEQYDPERAFVDLYGDSDSAFWLDSSRVDSRARFSFIGSGDGPLAAVVQYDVTSGEVRIERAGGSELRTESIFDFLSGEMRRLHQLDETLPFEFNCGYVGYFGYECKADCGGKQAHRSPMPDAAFLFADRVIAFDHSEQATYVLCVTAPDGAADGARWIAETCGRLACLKPLPLPDCGADTEPAFVLSRSHGQYLEDIATCKQRLVEGETYEVCLTNAVNVECAAEPLALYRTLRRVNPAPFCAYLRFGARTVLSSSPERFVSVGRDRWVEAKPIKGTSPRGATAVEDVRLAERLRTSDKNRAENLMIADLTRNDLGVVCEVGTVHVPQLMAVESYETVHQLVSTVRGLLRSDLEPPDCIRACFPAGSMTGAPKRRTMEIIDELEGQARGVYSGAIGYLGLGGGCDLSVVIRTIVIDHGHASIGVGGAIVIQSDAEDEYQETLLKARAPMAAIDPSVDLQTVFEREPDVVAPR
jgi:para-aminobenzoate synthetase